MSHRLHRRQFLRSTAAASAGFLILSRAERAGGRSPNQRVAIACIGVGGKGRSDTDHAGLCGEVVALCDIDDIRLKETASRYPNAKTFHDYRELLDTLGDRLDAVVVSTPDHTHAVASVAAMKLGKHVYCQKPLAHSPAEARAMMEAARAHGVATQMGNQGTASDGFRTGVELIRSGRLGPITEVHVWTNRPFKYWKQAPDIVSRPTETPPVPEHVHWDLFVGPAPMRPYHPVYHPHDWRGWWDFGTGSLGDMACHTANLPFMGLQLGYPTRVSAQSGPINPETYPAWATITYEFPARGDLPPVKMTWYEGAKDGQRNLPDPALFQGRAAVDSGSLLVGEDFVLYSPSDYGMEQVLWANGSSAALPEPPERTLERLGGEDERDLNNKREWVRAIEGGPAPLSNFDYAAVLTEAMLLGNVAVRLGRPIDYDAETMTVSGVPEAARLISPAFRSGWSL
ncbi:Gfo/Idh/MocA family protein [Tautonia sociabilis]|uniref:Gfo/Idh/MocA family oxidoreductase n=1 Tax=Tautonia sociabilis TaxID=2080755 RepID=A0A432MQ61_9BACT|nr:Gfo/Idh/MocA family oxidoreductase [Tautonia sociabilis]RUL89148.1 Gfo/Idh/MocA family oxidoreductase [Tautonia sociabilis]